MMDVTVDNKVFTFCYLSTHTIFHTPWLKLVYRLQNIQLPSSADYRSLNLNAYINKKDILIGR